MNRLAAALQHYVGNTPISILPHNIKSDSMYMNGVSNAIMNYEVTVLLVRQALLLQVSHFPKLRVFMNKYRRGLKDWGRFLYCSNFSGGYGIINIDYQK